MRRSFVWTGAVSLLLSAGGLPAQTPRDEKVRADRRQFEESDQWIYNDLATALRLGREQKKPLLVVFRCIPCEACHEFDEAVAARDPVVRDLMDRFVCVRIVQANGLDLTRFQFDFDQSFAAAVLHPDGTLIGRFGTRSGRDNEADDISLAGLRETLERSLAIFGEFDREKPSLEAKQVREARFAAPEDYPWLRGKYTSRLDYDGAVAKSCIHCHQVGEAERAFYRDASRPVPDAVLFPSPNPRVLGLGMDPGHATTVLAVEADSAAARAGFQPGDRITRFDGQPPISTADLQWALHHAPDRGRIAAQVSREGKPLDLELELPEGWRRRGDLSWRATTWDLRRRAFGGLQLEPLDAEARRGLELPADALALRVKHAGEYGEHARARKAGVRPGDVLVGYDGRTSAATETDLLAHALQRKRQGDPVTLELLRDGNRFTVSIALQ